MSKLLAVLVCFASLVFQASAEVRLSDAVAVIVHTNVITARDIDERVLPSVEMLYTQYANNPEELNKRAMDLRREAIDSLVEQELILQDFKESKLMLPDDYVEKEVKRRIRERYGDRMTMIRTLKAQSLTYDDFYNHIRNEVILQAMRGKYVNSVTIVSPQMIVNYYNEHQDSFKVEDQARIRTIMLLKNKEHPETTRELAQEILKQIQAGAAFDEMVTLYSEDQALKGRKDAHLEWRDRMDMQKELADKTFSMKPGEVSDLVETDAAVWIIKLEDLRPAHIRNIEEVRGAIESEIKSQMQAKLKKEWIDRLKKKYLVRYY
ncbi:MAG: peptidyl-prolyl cis-trans isomerase [Verrucomicrobia bacterium]|nr:peptidyl-prolyl cis-trans isomerase [Verrucomicrobiota bacterium]MBR4250079.1 peptidyl-prolyl cis-trans isomerase [Verrucomicrobiota bacterium]